MGNTNKTFSLLLVVILAVSSLMTVESASAQSIPKPSVPEFTVTLKDTSYDVSPTASVNPYTGETITNEGRHVESRTIEIRIKNEPFSPLEIQAGTARWTVGYFYQIRWKGHFEDQWNTMFLTDDLLGRNSGSETMFALEGTYSLADGLSIHRQGMYAAFLSTIPPKSQLDFQVKAMIGYVHRVLEGGMAPWIFTGEESDWSNTQTITIPETSTSTSPSPNPTPTPSIPEFPSWTVPLLLSTMLVVAGLLVYHKKHKHNSVKKV